MVKIYFLFFVYESDPTKEHFSGGANITKISLKSFPKNPIEIFYQYFQMIKRKRPRQSDSDPTKYIIFLAEQILEKSESKVVKNTDTLG